VTGPAHSRVPSGRRRGSFSGHGSTPSRTAARDRDLDRSAFPILAGVHAAQHSWPARRRLAVLAGLLTCAAPPDRPAPEREHGPARGDGVRRRVFRAAGPAAGRPVVTCWQASTATTYHPVTASTLLKQSPTTPFLKFNRGFALHHRQPDLPIHGPGQRQPGQRSPQPTHIHPSVGQRRIRRPVPAPMHPGQRQLRQRRHRPGAHNTASASSNRASAHRVNDQ
jgi:hypothetical protein